MSLISVDTLKTNSRPYYIASNINNYVKYISNYCTTWKEVMISLPG